VEDYLQSFKLYALTSKIMVRPIVGWTAKGDEYRIEGGKSYIKDGCYNITLHRMNGIYEIWKVPAKDFDIEKLRCMLEGPLEACKKGPFGREFLKKFGKLIHERRLKA